MRGGLYTRGKWDPTDAPRATASDGTDLGTWDPANPMGWAMESVELALMRRANAPWKSESEEK